MRRSLTFTGILNITYLILLFIVIVNQLHKSQINILQIFFVSTNREKSIYIEMN